MPAEVFPPCEYIAEEMEARGWTFDDLAERVGMEQWPERERLRKVVVGTGRVTVSMSIALGNAFGTSWQFWLSLQKSYDQHRREVS